jgi:hypothetical protein
MQTLHPEHRLLEEIKSDDFCTVTGDPSAYGSARKFLHFLDDDSRCVHAWSNHWRNHGTTSHGDMPSSARKSSIQRQTSWASQCLDVNEQERNFPERSGCSPIRSSGTNARAAEGQCEARSWLKGRGACSRRRAAHRAPDRAEAVTLFNGAPPGRRHQQRQVSSIFGYSSSGFLLAMRCSSATSVISSS